jgi:hypothetical protein
MKIITIFDKHLYAFQFGNENELRRLLNLWNDTLFLYQFVKDNLKDLPKNISIIDVVNKITDDANEIDEILNNLSVNGSNFDYFFKPLDNSEYRAQILSKRKGRKNFLRIYSIKIDTNCYIITGGAIKLEYQHLMQDRPHTIEQIVTLERCKRFLMQHGVIDGESFYELLNEEL